MTSPHSAPRAVMLAPDFAPLLQVPDLVAPSPQVRSLGHEVVETVHDVLEALRSALEGNFAG